MVGRLAAPRAAIGHAIDIDLQIQLCRGQVFPDGVVLTGCLRIGQRIDDVAQLRNGHPFDIQHHRIPIRLHDPAPLPVRRTALKAIGPPHERVVLGSGNQTTVCEQHGESKTRKQLGQAVAGKSWKHGIIPKHGDRRVPVGT